MKEFISKKRGGGELIKTITECLRLQEIGVDF